MKQIHDMYQFRNILLEHKNSNIHGTCNHADGKDDNYYFLLCSSIVSGYRL